ncbi:bifunctional lycopene cyclase/phytoene synthase-like isoform X1 [Dinothrombium tinctorium]|uniref:15-cis-phytoene synthase n=1 Tax=Dinothrombium tinctorium TaxID=1965070 RepID=A0A3S3NJB0_9ACAR|nr:bifunctional lycopene cyclase/phytoene synthase-like isoform X1 [Dinothrombium tinctorium]RWS03830.1 bifunctional lycopene cyclase/phytoene synthase-like isoform X1 [Dinothrombium tinctorium]RWS03831.1 bifunctional lycopene cyclase/phytoene synthase-like isoform X1 [Dinothrombium tinctorium]
MQNGIITEEAKKIRRRKLDLLKRFVKKVFAPSNSPATYESNYDSKSNLYSKIDWSIYEREMTADEIACLRAFNRVSFLLPSKNFEELIAAYESDVNEMFPKNMKELMKYVDYTGGSLGELGLYAVHEKLVFGYEKINIDDKSYEKIIHVGREIGKFIQLINFARDIVADSIELKRCYIPVEFLENPDKELELLIEKQDPWAIGEQKLRKYALKLIDHAENLSKGKIEYNALQKDIRFAFYAYFSLYYKFGEAIKMNERYVYKAKLSKFTILWILIKILVLKRIFGSSTFELQ